MGREVAPELAQNLFPVEFAGGNLVELLFEARREIIFHIAVEEILQERCDQPSPSVGKELALVDDDIVAILQGLERRRVSRGPPDAELFHLLDERGFGIARRRLGEMLGGVDRAALGTLFRAHFRQTLVVVVFVALTPGIVAMVDIGGEEAVEADHLTARPQLCRLVARGREDLHRRSLDLGRGHLAGDAALPDQLVKAQLVAVQEALDIFGRAGKARRADRFVGFLGVLGLGRIVARLFRQIALAEPGLDRLAGVGDRFGRHLDAVGSHISDEADRLAAELDALVKLLSHLHGARSREAELGGGGLLKAGGGERRAWIAASGLGFDALDPERGAFQHPLDSAGLVAIADGQTLDLFAVEGGQTSVEGIASLGREMGDDLPIFFRFEPLDLGFPVADQTQGDRLDAARRAGARQLAPQDRREREANQIVERAPSEIGVHQRLVDLARIGDRIQHRLFGDRVEDHAADRLLPERPLLA